MQWDHTINNYDKWETNVPNDISNAVLWNEREISHMLNSKSQDCLNLWESGKGKDKLNQTLNLRNLSCMSHPFY